MWRLFSEFLLKLLKSFFFFFQSQGQVESCVKIQERAPKDALFYIVAQGSKLMHVTAAKQGNDEQTLYFTVPGKSFLDHEHSLYDRLFPHQLPEIFIGLFLCLLQAMTAQKLFLSQLTFIQRITFIPVRVKHSLNTSEMFPRKLQSTYVQTGTSLAHGATKRSCKGFLHYCRQLVRRSVMDC